MSYNRWGSTYLFELGLATQVTALIWLGGPLSQVIIQPIVGKPISL